MQVVWSPKGGVGSTTVATVLAWELAAVGSACLVDPRGDAVDALGVEAPALGLGDWMHAPDAPDDALARLTVGVTPSLGLLGPGVVPVAEALDPDALRAGLAAVGAPAVVDAGTSPVAARLIDAADESIVVLRNDALALAAFARCGHVADVAVVVIEPGRVLRRHDVAESVGCPIVAVPFELSMARAIDVGLRSAGVPRAVGRAVAALR